MRIILLPFTAILVVILAIILSVAAIMAMLVSYVATSAAWLIIHLLIFQESETLIKIMAIFGTELPPNTKEMQ